MNILITRQLDQSIKFSMMLKKANIKNFIFPAITIENLTPSKEDISNIEKSNFIIFTSQNSVLSLAKKYPITNLSGSNTIKLTNDNICSVSQILNDVCGPCYDPSAPSDLPCDAPALDLSQPFFGTTDCDLYGVSNTGLMPGPDNLETSCFGNGISAAIKNAGQ